MITKIFFLLSALTICNVHSTVCDDFYRKDITSFNLQSEISSWEAYIRHHRLNNLLRRLRGSGSDPAINTQAQRYWLSIKSDLVDGKYANAKRMLIPILSEVESLTHIISKLDPFLKVLKDSDYQAIDYSTLIEQLKAQNVTNSLIEYFSNQLATPQTRKILIRDLEKQMNRFANKIGQNFQHYVIIKAELKKLKKSSFCNSDCRKVISSLTDTQDTFSANYLSKVYPIIGSFQQVSLDDVLSVAKRYRSVATASMRRETVEELIQVIRVFVFQPPLAKILYSLIKRSPRLSESTVSTLFRFIENQQYINLFFSEIDQFSYSTRSLAEIWPSLKAKADNIKSTYNGNDLFIKALARNGDPQNQQFFKELYQYVKQVNEPQWVERFEAAKRTRDKKGLISASERPSPVSILAWMTGTASAQYILVQAVKPYFDFEVDEQEEFIIKISEDEIEQLDQLLEDFSQVLDYDSDLLQKIYTEIESQKK